MGLPDRSIPTEIDSVRSSATIVEMLSAAAVRHPDKPAFAFLADGENPSGRLSYGEVHHLACANASRLSRVLEPGSRVLVAYPSSLHFVVGFLACMYAGLLPVPVYALSDTLRSDAPLRHIDTIAGNSAASAVLVGRSNMARHAETLARLPHLSRTPLYEIHLTSAALPDDGFSPYRWKPRQVAYLQYTSGSTSEPKGIKITHANLMANLGHIAEMTIRDRNHITIGTWLPLYHDLGLIANVLFSIYSGSELVFMDPYRFIQRPLRWLKMISRFGIVASGGPNFAFDLCTRAATPDRIAGLDLSSWEVAYNCSEPIHSRTLTEFHTTFGAIGLRESSLMTLYGLAEATLLVTCSKPGFRPLTIRLPSDRISWSEGRAISSDEDTVSSGSLPRDVRVAIVGQDFRRRLEGDEGEIWVQGPSVGGGYWKNEQLSREIFGAVLADEPDGPPWLRTGDLGRSIDDQLYITGRLKDVIVVRGTQIYPSDIEDAVQNLDRRLKRGAGAVLPYLSDQQEVYVIVQETTADTDICAQLAKSVHTDISKIFGAPPFDILFVETGQIPKTLNGKLQRRKAAEMFERGHFRYKYSFREDSRK